MIAGSRIPSGSIYVDLEQISQPPSLKHLFGTDWVGRDMLTRTMKGLSLSIWVGIICSLASTLTAALFGILAPTLGGRADALVSWLVDLTLSVPHTILIILISIACGGGFRGIVAGVAATHWTSLTRVIRAEVLRINTSEYVRASRQFGKSRRYIARNHLLPHVIPQMVVGTVLVFPHAILHEASITFLGFGLPPHEPAIGVILSESMKYLTSGQWWLAFFPGLCLIMVSVMVSALGRSLERILNPATAYKK
jgi:peptide/nickel transport system permease protein